MALNQHCLFLAILFVFAAVAYSNSSPSLSYEALKAGSSSSGRFLRQTEKNCPINMKRQNFTILTSKCKWPTYSAPLCCDGLLEFCCGFVDQLNDMANNCAETMFSYINIYGKYPPGLFYKKCKEGPQGLSCDKALRN